MGLFPNKIKTNIIKMYFVGNILLCILGEMHEGLKRKVNTVKNKI